LIITIFEFKKKFYRALKMNTMKWKEATQEEKDRILSRLELGSDDSADLKDKVATILTDVRKNGDTALRYYTKLFEGRDVESFKIHLDTDGLLRAKKEELKDYERKAILVAYENIFEFHQLQIPKTLKLEKGGYTLWKSFSGIERVGIYVPAGTAPLVSTLLMLACPAKLAGCNELVLVTPAKSDGTIDPALLFAAVLCGITEAYALGGAQAIAALAFGTESIKKVSKIFGPGNQFVTEAKLQVSQDSRGCVIDLPAGPSEVLVIADQFANPEFVASDLLSQAEHDPNAKSVLVSTSSQFLKDVQTVIASQVTFLSRQSILKESISRMQFILVDNILEALEVANAYSPEHLILQVEEPMNLVGLVRNAGSVFIGPWSAEALGDFVTGPNHVLPTAGYAKSLGGVGVESFMKPITFQYVRKEGFLMLAESAHILGGLEGLDGHQQSIAIRRKAMEVDRS
jgi:histidinol dehydrogenase